MVDLKRNIYICFPEGKHKVLTMSYDDGKEEDRKLIDIFNQHGIKGTFFVNSGITHDETRIPQSEYKELYKGHEIACHTLTHPTIERCPMEQIVTQVMEDRKNLEQIMGYPVRGMSYPNGSYNEAIKKVLPSLGIRYSRIVGNSDNFAMPRDYYEWRSTCHHNHNLIKLGQEFTRLHKTQYLYMMYVWGHSYEFTGQNNWNVMEGFCAMVGKQDDIWYATNIEIVDYMDNANRLQYAADLSFVYNPSASTIWISVGDNIKKVPGGTQIFLT